MSHIIRTPTEIEACLYEGRLEFTEGSVEQKNLKAGTESELTSLAPIVTLGQPQWWNLAQLIRERGESLAPELSMLLQDADFYLLQLACSFRPQQKNQHVEWTRFAVYLRSKQGHKPPIAFDLYPREIYDETKKDVKVNIAPSLKFAIPEGISAEGVIGSVVTTIEFRKLEPVVIGYGMLESNPGWDFERYKEQPLRGSKFCYLIVKKPLGAEAVRMTLDITADVMTKHGLLSAKVRKKDRARLSQTVCID